MNNKATCQHHAFSSAVRIARLEDSGRFMAEIRITCSERGTPFQFKGLPPGLNLNGATVSIDGLEANIAIAPDDKAMSPMQQMMHGDVRKQ
jgi:hypothetical protein